MATSGTEDVRTVAFADLVSSDPELVRAEFDALIAAAWDDEPPADDRTGRTADPSPVGRTTVGPPPVRGRSPGSQHVVDAHEARERPPP
jgi:hypothetical protein